MTEGYKLNLIKKEMDLSNEYEGIPFTETRWFVETNDGFDGTAQGYGYKTAQKLYKAYAYFKTKGKRGQENNSIKQFLACNPDVINALNIYLDEEREFYRMKDREPTTIENMLEHHKDEPEFVKNLQDHKHLWKALIKYGREHILLQIQIETNRRA